MTDEGRSYETNNCKQMVCKEEDARLGFKRDRERRRRRRQLEANMKKMANGDGGQWAHGTWFVIMLLCDIHMYKNH